MTSSRSVMPRNAACERTCRSSAVSSGYNSMLRRGLPSDVDTSLLYGHSRLNKCYTHGMAEWACANCGKPVVRPGANVGINCSKACWKEWARRSTFPDRAWLENEYVTKGRHCPDIGQELGKDASTVHYWLEQYGIPRRPRGSNSVTNFPLGAKPFQGGHHTEEVKEAQRQRLLKSGHVPYLKNGVHWLKGKRGAEVPSWKGGVTPERLAFYSSLEWREVVKAVWHRDDAICQRCKLDHRTVDRKTKAFAIHHIVSFAVMELRAELSNLILLCRDCHLYVHSNANKQTREYIG